MTKREDQDNWNVAQDDASEAETRYFSAAEDDPEADNLDELNQTAHDLQEVADDLRSEFYNTWGHNPERY